MTDLVERAKAALEGVTEGPWRVEEYEDPGNTYSWRQPYIASPHKNPLGSWPEQIAKMMWRHKQVSQNRLATDDARRDADARFIVAARQLVPELVAEVERLGAEIDRMRAEGFYRDERAAKVGQ